MIYLDSLPSFLFLVAWMCSQKDGIKIFFLQKMHSFATYFDSLSFVKHYKNTSQAALGLSLSPKLKIQNDQQGFK